MIIVTERSNLAKYKSTQPQPKVLTHSLDRLYAKRVNGKILSARVFPSGDFSVGVIPPQKISPKDDWYESTHGKIEVEQYAYQDSATGQVYYSRETKAESVSIPNLVVTPKLSQTRKGLYGITPYGRKMVRSGAALLEQKWGVRRCGMGTFTLPPMSENAMRKVATNWSEICRRLFQELKRDYEATVGSTFEYTYCTEIQERRSDREGVPVLHIHFIYRYAKWGRGDWTIDARRARDVWKRIIKSYAGDIDDNVDYRVRLEGIRKTAVGYIGKYLSKGVKAMQTWKDRGCADMLPSSWWGMSACLRKSIAAKMIESKSAFADWLWQACADGDKVVLSYVAEIFIGAVGQEQRRVGYAGRADYLLCKELCQELDTQVTT